MAEIRFGLETAICESFRVQQIKGMFDLELSWDKKLRQDWALDVDFGDHWKIGLIVGPSGSGKSSVVRHMFSDSIHTGYQWSKDRSILDSFPEEVEINEIVSVFNAVGFSSPPSWLKPFHILSNGEQFRVELARAIIEAKELLVMDEFTSVVDRVVAKIGSCAVAKAIRKRDLRFIAVSCHYDIVDWLAPDWVLDMKNGKFSRRCLWRPEIKLSIAKIQREAWRIFAKHHYLSGKLNKAAACYGCFWEGNIVAFAAVMSAMGHKNIRRIHRIVVLPDYQGVGIGKAFLTMLGQEYTAKGVRLRIVSSHPGIVKGLKRDENWRCAQFYPRGTGVHSDKRLKARTGIISASYEFVPLDRQHLVKSEPAKT